MKKTLISFLAVSGLMLAAEAPPVPARPGVPREITVTDRSVPEVGVTILESTLIGVPDPEKVVQVVVGDSVNYLVTTPKESRYVTVKVTPDAPANECILHILTDRGNEYSLKLVKRLGESNTFDPKVLIRAGDQKAQQNIEAAPVWIPAADVERYKVEAKEARDHEAATVKNEQSAIEKFRADYPGTLHFDYAWDVSKGRKFGVTQIFRDDKFTYIAAHPQETPSLYEVKDGKPSLINFTFSNGLYAVPKILTQGYLAIGNRRLPFNQD